MQEAKIVLKDSTSGLLTLRGKRVKRTAPLFVNGIEGTDVIIHGTEIDTVIIGKTTLSIKLKNGKKFFLSTENPNIF